jgi:hypothetical protein
MEWSDLVTLLVDKIPDYLREVKGTPKHPALKSISSDSMSRVLVDFMAFSIRNPPVVPSVEALRKRENLPETNKEMDKQGWAHSVYPFEVIYVGEEKTTRWSEHSVEARRNEAVKAHREECGCAWPEHDYVHDLKKWMDRIFMDKLYDVGVIELLANFCERGMLLNNLDVCIKIADYTALQNLDSVDGEPIIRIAEILHEIAHAKKNGALNPLMFSDPTCWSFCSDCGKGIPPWLLDRELCASCALKGAVA